ncbi:ferredoxin [Paraburkholderia sp. WC7.3g]
MKRGAVGESIEHKCNGKADCGSRHLFVREGRKSLSKIQRLENDKLDTVVGIGSKSRLACQAVLAEEPVTIELLTSSERRDDRGRIVGGRRGHRRRGSTRPCAGRAYGMRRTFPSCSSKRASAAVLTQCCEATG